MIDIAIVGAGPYGLSIATHVKAEGLGFRIFGSPMQTWLANMPRGMMLKSEGSASSLYDPESRFPLEHYCREKGIQYADQGLPVRLETFTSYGLEFQRRFVPELEKKFVVSVRRGSSHFEVSLEDGEVVAARKVVVAVGLSHYEYTPPVLSGFPEELVTHSSRHSTVEQFKNRQVVVVGAGASALDLAALLHQAGASVQVVARRKVIRFHDPPAQKPPSLLERIRNPQTGIGAGWEVFFCANAPLMFRHLPEHKRLEAVKRILGPAPGWFIKDQVVGKVPLIAGVTISHANAENGKVRLQLTDDAGAHRSLLTAHVIAATGYKVNLERLRFLDSTVQAGIRSIENTPILSSNFESSVPGLYFVGTSAANTFGPLLRFAVGARFTAKRLSRHLVRSASRKSRQSPIYAEGSGPQLSEGAMSENSPHS